ncbi:hypothetical protein AAFN75_03245 [Algibacter sp. AS12]|uniref:hypothetical protein n=1 Tax=Algibacter sp. AS12 TaxID=3135773 RepID=UPI00398BB736
MGGEGSMMAANNSLKNNRSLTSKRREKGALGGSYANIGLKEFPHATPVQLIEIKQRLKKEHREARIKYLVVFLLLLFVIIPLFWFLLQ